MRGFRIVVAGHGDLAAAFLASAEMIAGPIEDSRAVGLDPGHAPEHFAELLREAVGTGPCLILADLLNGTPSTVALVVARRSPDVVVIAGMNLVLLIEAAMSLTSLDDEAIGALVAASRGAIVNASARLVRSRS